MGERINREIGNDIYTLLCIRYGEGNATHSSVLAWRISWMKEPDGPQVMGAWWAPTHGVARSQTRLSDSHTHTYIRQRTSKNPL